jgi:PmbA protein
MADNRFSFSQDTLKTIAEDILKFARKRGATACEVDISEGFGQSVSVRRDEVDTIEYNRDKGVGVTIYDGQKRGYASTSDFSKSALKATVDAAISIARFTAPDPAAGLPEEALLARSFPDFDLYHPWKLSTEEAIELARCSERAAFAVSPRNPQFGWCRRLHAGGPLHLGQQPRLHGWLRQLPPRPVMLRHCRRRR